MKQQKQNIKCLTGKLQYLSLLDVLFLLVALLCGLASSGLYPTAFWIYGNVIKLIVGFSQSGHVVMNQTCPNRHIQTHNSSSSSLFTDISVYIYQYVYFGLAILCTHFVAYFLWGIAIERYTTRLRSELYKSLIRQEISWFDTFKLGECNLLYGSVDKLKLAYGTKFIDFMILISRAIACFIFAFYSCWKLALALTAVMPISIVFFVVTIITMKKYTVAENKAHASVMALGEEVLSAIKVVIAYGGQKSEVSNFDRLLNTAKAIAIKKGTVVGVTSGVAGFFNSASYAVLIGFGTFVFQTDCSFDSGNIIQTFAALIIATLAVSQALPFVKEFGEGRLASKRIFEILDKKSKADVFNRDGIALGSSIVQKFDIEFKNLSFKYPSNEDSMVIKNLNFKIPFGKTVGICGPSGCGKSTLTRLLMRIYEPTNGHISYGSHLIKDFQLAWWRSQISIVSPNAAFFTMSIKENIRLANPSASDQDIINAAVAANADEFIRKLPDGYDTIIGPKGKDLSGGEKQRVSIARAFLSNSKILILDEATSALDNRSETLVQESMERLKRGKTTIIIAHRLSTIKDADLIIEMQRGEITDFGKHEDLVQRKGFYFSLLSAAATSPKQESSKVKKNAEPDLQDEEETIEVKIVDSSSSVDVDTSIRNPQAKVWQLSRPEWHWILMTGVASFLQGSIYPLIAFSFCQLIEIFSLTDNKRQTEMSLTFTGVVIALAIVSFVAQFLQSFSATKSGAELTSRIRHMLFSSLVNKDFIFFASPLHKPHVLMSKMSSKTPLLKGYTSERVGIILNFISSVGIPLTMSLVFSWKLALVISLFIPVALIWGFMQGQFLRSTGASKIKEAIAVASETVNHVYTVTLFNLQEHFCSKVDALFKSNINRMILILLIEAFFYSLGYTLYFFVQAATFGYGSVLLQNGEIEAKVMIFIFLSILFSSMYLGKNISSLPDVPKAKKAAEWVFKMIYSDTPTIETDNGAVLSDFKGNIQFQNVHFKYPNTENEILKGVNLKFNFRESNALVGNSGGGKSTIISLIQRYYDVTSGCIKVDDVDITKLNVNWLRSKMAIVFQEPILFNRSIKENIAYGLEPASVTMEMIIEAANKAAIHSKIAGLPQGYDTVISSNMLMFSSGENQRISIARALIREPTILLLDEATSTLDNISEKHIQTVLDKVVQSRTSIMIAHRLSTIVNSNKIIVLKDGLVLEEGDHKRLMDNQGFYYELQTKH